MFTTPSTALSLAHYVVTLSQDVGRPLTLQQLGYLLSMLQFECLTRTHRPCFLDNLLDQFGTYIPNSVVVCYSQTASKVLQPVMTGTYLFASGNGGISSPQWIPASASAHLLDEEQGFVMEVWREFMQTPEAGQTLKVQMLRQRFQVEAAPFLPRHYLKSVAS